MIAWLVGYPGFSLSTNVFAGPVAHSGTGMDDLTFEGIIGIHQTVMKKTGGDTRLLSEPTLHELVFRVNGAEDVFRKGAMAAFLIAAYPPFREGNEGTALGLVKFILSREGYILAGDAGDFSRLMQGVASFEVEQEDIENWLHTHLRNS